MGSADRAMAGRASLTGSWIARSRAAERAASRSSGKVSELEAEWDDPSERPEVSDSLPSEATERVEEEMDRVEPMDKLENGPLPVIG